MPWSELRFPPAMAHLSSQTRAKAIEIANAMLAEGAEDGMAIRVGIAQAKRWAARHGADPETDRMVPWTIDTDF